MTITASLSGFNKLTKELEDTILMALGKNYSYLIYNKGTIKVVGKDLSMVEALESAGLGVVDIRYFLQDDDFTILMDNL